MKSIPTSAGFKQKRKFYTLLPVLILPFLTLFYWAVAVKIFYKKKNLQEQPQGLNTKLPAANLTDEHSFTKLSYYKKAADDSARFRELLKKDPYRSAEIKAKTKETEYLAIQGLGLADPANKAKRQVSITEKTSSSYHQTQILKKLKTLDSVLISTTEPDFTKDTPLRPASKIRDSDFEKFQSVMNELEQKQSLDARDPELVELNGMLDKILDIQHPERAADKIRSHQQNTQPLYYPVNSAQQPTPITLLDSLSTDSLSQPPVVSSFEPNGFYTLDEQVSSKQDNAIHAAVHETQTLVSGATIKLRLTADIYVAGTLIPKDHFIYGTVSLNAERLMVQINSIRLNGSLFPVKLAVYDLDGQEGIYMPGSIARNVAKQSVSQDIQALPIGSFDPSLGAQAASAGIQAARTMLGRKAKLLQVTVKAGYQILLKDTKSV